MHKTFYYLNPVISSKLSTQFLKADKENATRELPTPEMWMICGATVYVLYFVSTLCVQTAALLNPHYTQVKHYELGSVRFS